MPLGCEGVSHVISTSVLTGRVVMKTFTTPGTVKQIVYSYSTQPYSNIVIMIWYMLNVCPLNANKINYK